MRQKTICQQTNKNKRSKKKSKKNRAQRSKSAKEWRWKCQRARKNYQSKVNELFINNNCSSNRQQQQKVHEIKLVVYTDKYMLYSFYCSPALSLHVKLLASSTFTTHVCECENTCKEVCASLSLLFLLLLLCCAAYSAAVWQLLFPTLRLQHICISCFIKFAFIWNLN